MEKLQFEIVRNVKSPTRGTPGSAGIDFYIPNKFPNVEKHQEKEIYVPPGLGINIPSGVECKIPKGYALIAFNKSGVAVNEGFIVGACVVDSDYEGEVHLHVCNVGTVPRVLHAGQKLVQFLLIPVSHDDFDIVESIKRDGKSERGTGGFGSTNV